jgi:hypothetical protein
VRDPGPDRAGGLGEAERLAQARGEADVVVGGQPGELIARVGPCRRSSNRSGPTRRDAVVLEKDDEPLARLVASWN